MHQQWAVVLNEVERARKELGCSNRGAYYRGHSCETHSLLPTLLRANIGVETERNLYAESYIHAHADVRDCRSSWETLSLLQHYGIPTRLLDWTDSFAVAVFFAVATGGKSPTVWVINPFRMTRDNADRSGGMIFTVGVDELPDYYDCYIANSQKWPYSKPVFLEIPWNNRRVISQRGYFTFHPNVTPLEESCRKYVRKIAIPESAVSASKRFLEFAGVHEHSIFPDLAGLGQFLRVKYRL